MGMDFVALMKYGGPDERVLRALDRLEAGSPEPLRAVRRLMEARRFFNGAEAAAVWEFRHRGEVRDPRLDGRPRLPRLSATLQLPEGFRLTFGPDAVEVEHLLPWWFFLTEPPFHRAMLDACLYLAPLFGAADGILTSDCSPVIQAFREGKGFDAAVASAGPEDGERPHLADLYTEIPGDQVTRVVPRPRGRGRTESMAWDRDRPLPEGWEREATWDSHGYWRLSLSPPAQARAGPPTAAPVSAESPRPRPVRAASRMDERRWATSGEPEAMLEWLLKQDGDGRKIRLWACACVRRLWARLATDTSRRAVEMVERFADGQVTRQAM